MTRRVVLVHGLWMPRVSMAWIGHRLRAAGWSPELFGYPTIRGGPDAAMPRLAALLARGPAHVVAHSLGGLVALAALQHAQVQAQRVVCLGSPLHGSSAAERLWHHRWGAFALGRSARLLRHGCEPCARGVDVGVVAGSHAIGFGRLVSRLDGASDGTVAVEETRIAGLTDHVTVYASHTGLLVSAAAVHQAAAFLSTGRFDHAADDGSPAGRQPPRRSA